ncbi:AmmeMemoRadiSam system protein A [Syntrophomonas zehnderi OL-4]|uniref:AmmeMemoRadiSam system protein A n=1 Tax=Syntrophomonas zehnderi OL-4 TaxID=690567 RepID=A0A0E4GA39_9FIRM|nr:AmmeMemoRadiSam system protein A [Syntrophomonas zehnderi]CFX05785.1 AmmeMemoRadiSam system protein A [Syntrophomonas zehnderi OL-4]CFX34285.1 AmmeMemoRadiSam system protein A [Syntrophomonas zehnderi OL-4]
MICYGALMPHAPVLISEIGGQRVNDVQATVKAMQEVAARLVASQPDCVLFLTPHGNVFSDCITYLVEDNLEGDLGDFGQPQIRTSRVNNPALLDAIAELALDSNVEFVAINENLAERFKLMTSLDHGIMVPLYFLEQAGIGDVPIAAISIGLLNNQSLYVFGQMIQEASNLLNQKVAIVASGDMSHRLKEDGPYGFHPDGSRFDLAIKEALGSGDVLSILEIPPVLRENAGECGYPSLLILLGAMDRFKIVSDLISYEGPFGVGYMTAGIEPGEIKASMLGIMRIIQNEKMNARRAEESPLVRWARLNLESEVTRNPPPQLEEDMQGLLEERAAVFVSLKKQGQLRGCIGTFLPSYENLAEEIAQNARAAGLEDPRFNPVQVQELKDIEYSVDVLSRPEPCSAAELDPRKYGVIVTKGSRRGLLLPDLEGVDTVEQQLRIACQKADISYQEDFKIERFEVKRYT